MYGTSLTNIWMKLVFIFLVSLLFNVMMRDVFSGSDCHVNVKLFLTVNLNLTTSDGSWLEVHNQSSDVCADR